jgi:hypothetical protein
MPTAKDLDARRGSMPSKSLCWHTFGSLAAALREAGFDVLVGEERLERAVEQDVALARKLKRLPKFAVVLEALLDQELERRPTRRDGRRTSCTPATRVRSASSRFLAVAQSAQVGRLRRPADALARVMH